MKAIGLMSGTSADALDIALVEIIETELPRVNLIKYKQIDYSPELRERIDRAIHSREIGLEELADLNFDLGKFYAEEVLKFLKEHRITPGTIKVIGSHGQTIFHRSNKEGRGNTLQIGDGAVISKLTGIPVVSDFRIDDIVVGGEGAPLTPYFHYILFRDFGEAAAIVNTGGISNITALPPENDPEKIIAFDTGPGNSLLDVAVQEMTGGKDRCDRDGKFSREGIILPELFDQLKEHPYLRMSPPKSTGRKVFGRELLHELINNRHYRIEDITRTLAEFTAYSIYDAYRRFIEPKYKITMLVVTGGGAKNPTIFEALKNYFAGIIVKRMDEFGIDPDAVEAMAFAFFGYETLYRKHPINIPAVTGAKRKVVCGKVSYP